jgi:peptidoglycan lytic transglycosylase G
VSRGDELQIFDPPDAGRQGRGRSARAGRSAAKRRRRKRAITAFVLLVLLAGLAAGAWYGWRELRGIGDIPDYAGAGESDVVVEVADGATTAQIGTELARTGVVASGAGFVRAATGNAKIRAVQPGFYVMKSKMSAASAVARLTDPAARVGRLEIRGGMQLDDVKLPSGESVPGILSLVAKASCAELNGQSTCVPADALRDTMVKTDPAALGVPDWAQDAAARAEPIRRLEGLVMPGRYDVRPGQSALELLTSLVQSSMVRMQAAGLPGTSESTGFTPYQVLVIASLVEKEGITADFGKVAQVIYNRLALPMPLKFDSTINYPLDRQEIRTTDDDRAAPGPYNTYLNIGLPPTPIAAPSDKAIGAAIKPEPGNWLFFNKCEANGLSCFAETEEQHQRNVDDARARGVF